MEALGQIKNVLEVVSTTLSRLNSCNTTGFEEPAIDSAKNNCLQLESALLQIQLLIVSNIERLTGSELDSATSLLLRQLSNTSTDTLKTLRRRVAGLFALMKRNIPGSEVRISMATVRKRQDILDLSGEIKTRAIATEILALGFKSKFEPKATEPAIRPLSLTPVVPQSADPSDKLFTLMRAAQDEAVCVRIVREKTMFSTKETINIKSQSRLRSGLAHSMISNLIRN